MTTHQNRVLHGDCIKRLAEVPAGSVNLIFADPPYNIDYKYDQYRDNKPKAEYLAWTDRWLAAVRRVLRPDGAIFVAINDEYAGHLSVKLEALGLTYRNTIIWHYSFGAACQKKFSRSHTQILYFAANAKRYTFDADAVRIASARQTTYGDRRAARGGKVPDDTWYLRPQEAEADGLFDPTSDTWFISRVCGTFRERTNHPCQMPEAILDRIIRSASRPGDVVCDPFAGSGTTLVVAARTGRSFVGIELSKNYFLGIVDRLQPIIPMRLRGSPTATAA